jgi:hypothetical protein
LVDIGGLYWPASTMVRLDRRTIAVKNIKDTAIEYYTENQKLVII